MKITAINTHEPGRTNVYVLNGIFTRHGRSQLAKLYPYLAEDFNVWEVYTGWISPVGAWLGNRRRSINFVQHLQVPYILMGHSNGAAIIARVTDHVATTRIVSDPIGVVLLAPALDRRWVPPIDTTWMHVYWTRNDIACQLIRPMDWPLIRKLSRWGGMGATGPSHAGLPNVRSVNLGERGHSATARQAAKWGPAIVAKINADSDAEDDESGPLLMFGP